MEIKDIVKQEKQKEAVLRMKKKQEKYTRKAFLKDCYKFWKEYKTVEKPYTWWCCIFTFDFIFSNGWYFSSWCITKAPEEYTKDSWFYNRWEIKIEEPFGEVSIKLKSQPNQDWVYLY